MKTVLVLDNRLHDLDRVRRVLGRAGYRTVGARDVETALAVLAYTRADLLLVDTRAIRRDELLDMEALHRLTDAEAGARTAIIVRDAITADVSVARVAGVAYLMRGFHEQELIRFVGYLLGDIPAPPRVLL